MVTTRELIYARDEGPTKRRGWMLRLALSVAAAFASVAARAEVGDWRWFDGPGSRNVHVEMSHAQAASPHAMRLLLRGAHRYDPLRAGMVAASMHMRLLQSGLVWRISADPASCA